MIEVTGVNKRFGEIKALDNIVATIQEGSIFGLVGTNGAGKSTLLRVISGVLHGTVPGDDLRIWPGIYKKAFNLFKRNEASGSTSAWHLCRNEVSCL